MSSSEPSGIAIQEEGAEKTEVAYLVFKAEHWVKEWLKTEFQEVKFEKPLSPLITFF